MATHIERGESLFIPFKNGQSISDSQLKPRMYKSVQNFEKTFPKHNYGTPNIELVEYAEVKHGEWIHTDKAMRWHSKDECSECTYHTYDREDLSHLNYCPNCGAKMDGRSDT